MFINKILQHIRRKYHPLWRLRGFAWFRNLQKFLDVPVTLKTGKIRYKVMLLRDLSIILNQNGQQEETLNTVRRLIKTEKITHLFDIGANIGLFTWQALNINKHINVLMVEPDKRNIILLKRSMKLNSLESVSLFEGVITNKTGSTQFYIDDISGATGSVKSFRANSSSLHCKYDLNNVGEVQSKTLDSFLDIVPEPHPKSVLLKIDVEGAEGEVFESAQQFIAKFKPFIIVECFAPATIKMLIPKGYKILPLAENCNYLLTPE